MEMSYAIDVFSNEWWRNTLICFVCMYSVLYVGKKLKVNKKHLSIYTLFVGVILLLRLFWNQWYQSYLGQWDVQWSLPLQMCSFSSMLSGIIPIMIFFNINKKLQNFLFHFLFYWSVGALYGLLTPQFTLGTQRFLYLDFYISHAGIVFVALFCIMSHDFKIEKNSWIKFFAFSQIVLLIIHSINRFIGGKANYFYTVFPPTADNPLVMGEFPFHIIMLDLFALVHFFLFYKAFNFFRNRQSANLDVAAQN